MKDIRKEKVKFFIDTKTLTPITRATNAKPTHSKIKGTKMTLKLIDRIYLEEDDLRLIVASNFKIKGDDNLNKLFQFYKRVIKKKFYEVMPKYSFKEMDYRSKYLEVYKQI